MKPPLEKSKTVESNIVHQSGADRKHEPIPKDVQEIEEIGGPGGPEPTRYGDWERKGRCVDF